MIVHAHPDDEVIGSGGTLLRYASEGVTTVLVTATGGEEGEIVDPAYNQIEAKPRLGEIRRVELRAAAFVLKIGALELLGYRDSGMAGTPTNENPDCLHQADLLEATARLVHLIRRYRPEVLVSYNDYGTYGHPDHIKAYQITHEAFARAADPNFAPEPGVDPWQPLKLYDQAMTRELVQMWHQRTREEREKQAANNAIAANGADAISASAPTDVDGTSEAFFQTMLERSTPLADVTTRIDVRAYDDQKREALRCHRTQIPADSDFFRSALEIDPRLRNFEHLNRVRSLVEAPEREEDLFAGLR